MTVVLIGKESGLAIVAALNHAQRYPDKGDAWPSWHVAIFFH
jgi:hypothetical protein